MCIWCSYLGMGCLGAVITRWADSRCNWEEPGFKASLNGFRADEVRLGAGASRSGGMGAVGGSAARNSWKDGFAGAEGVASATGGSGRVVRSMISGARAGWVDLCVSACVDTGALVLDTTGGRKENGNALIGAVECMFPGSFAWPHVCDIGIWCCQATKNAEIVRLWSD